ncbi:hypothetical protein ACFX11_012358 [Malus domestica]
MAKKRKLSSTKPSKKQQQVIPKPQIKPAQEVVEEEEVEEKKEDVEDPAHFTGFLGNMTHPLSARPFPPAVASAVESIDNGHGGGSRLLSRAVDLGEKLGFCRLLDEGREKK